MKWRIIYSLKLLSSHILKAMLNLLDLCLSHCKTARFLFFANIKIKYVIMIKYGCVGRGENILEIVITIKIKIRISRISC